MSDSSDQELSSFSGVRLNHVRVLLGLVTSQVLRDKTYVRRRFLEHASEFEKTLAFLTGARVLNDDGITLSPASTLVNIDAEPEKLSGVLLAQLAKKNNRWSAEVFEYLQKFSVCGDQAIHRPTPEQRSSESGVRNFLMELLSPERRLPLAVSTSLFEKRSTTVTDFR
jgi:hypothetical protein